MYGGLLVGQVEVISKVENGGQSSVHEQQCKFRNLIGN
jgi:hypothetical protein